MTMRGSWIWLVEIEGLARDGLTANVQPSITPMALTSEPWPGDTAFAGGVSGRVCDEWQTLLQPGSVTLSAMSFSPFAAAPGAQTLSFALSLPPERPEVERFFLSQPEPVARLTAAVAPTDTTITMDDTTGIAAGDVLYIGAECFRVRTVDSGTQVTVCDPIVGGNSPVGPTLIWPDAIRSNAGSRPSDGAVGVVGAIGSRIAQHDIPAANEPPPWPDDRVYLANTRVKGRRVYLRRVSWGVNATGGEGYREQLFGQYVITSVNVNADGTTISVSANSLVASFDKAELGARGVADRILVTRSTPGNPALPATWAVAFIDRDQSPDAESRRIWRSTAVAYSSGSEAGFFVGLDAVNVLGRKVGVGTSRTLGVKFFAGDQQPSRDLVAQFDAESVGTAVKEVLLSDPFEVNHDTTGNEAAFGIGNFRPYYSTDKPGGAGVLKHPLHMLLAHLGQFSSNLPNHWQLRLDTSAVAVDAILQLADQIAVNEWPGVCATGPVKAMEWLAKTFLQPLACGWVTDEFGRLSVGSITMPRLSPWSVPDLAVLSDSLRIGVEVLAPGRQVQRIVEAEAGVTVVNVGQGLGKEPRIAIQSADAYRVPDGDPQVATFEINAMGALSPDDPIDNTAALQLTPIMFMRSIASTVGTYLRGGVIQYTLRIPSSYPDEDEAFAPFGSDVLGPAMPSRYAVPGALVVLSAIIPGLRKLPGERLAVVLGHQWQDDCATQEIRIADLGGTVRIAAAGRVVSASVVSGQLEIVLDPDFEVLPTPYNAPPFGAITEDGETLVAFATTAGDFEYVRFFDDTLAERNPGPGNAEQVASYNAATNTLTTSNGGGYTPVAGDFVLLANLGESDTAVEDYFAFMGRNRYSL
jgi:hypothetical protein